MFMCASKNPVITGTSASAKARQFAGSSRTPGKCSSNWTPLIGPASLREPHRPVL
jgi:hypothetical protein